MCFVSRLENVEEDLKLIWGIKSVPRQSNRNHKYEFKIICFRFLHSLPDSLTEGPTPCHRARS